MIRTLPNTAPNYVSSPQRPSAGLGVFAVSGQTAGEICDCQISRTRMLDRKAHKLRQ